MIKKWLIRVAIVVGVLIFFGILTYAQVFNFILKPFSDDCGYNSEVVQICECDGFSFNEFDEGRTNTYCLSTCQECSCYEKVNEGLISVDCEELVEG
jgi:hypothetical protein